MELLGTQLVLENQSWRVSNITVFFVFCLIKEGIRLEQDIVECVSCVAVWFCETFVLGGRCLCMYCDTKCISYWGSCPPKKNSQTNNLHQTELPISHRLAGDPRQAPVKTYWAVKTSRTVTAGRSSSASSEGS